jgi:hypothetical protein
LSLAGTLARSTSYRPQHVVIVDDNGGFRATTVALQRKARRLKSYANKPGNVSLGEWGQRGPGNCAWISASIAATIRGTVGH